MYILEGVVFGLGSRLSLGGQLDPVADVDLASRLDRLDFLASVLWVGAQLL